MESASVTENQSASPLKCSYCHLQFRDLSVRRLMTHLRETHHKGYRGIPDQLQCGNCTFNTTGTRKFTNHVTSKHGPNSKIQQSNFPEGKCSHDSNVEETNYTKTPEDVSQPEQMLPTALGQCPEPSVDDMCQEDADNTCADIQMDGSAHIESFVSRFVLELYSKGSTTRSTIQHVIEATSELMNTILEDVRRRSEELVKADDTLSVKMRNIFVSVGDPFVNYKTEYHRIKTLIAQGMVGPHEVAVGSRIDSQSSGTQTVASTIQYVPLTETLQLLYSKPEFRNAVVSNQTRDHEAGVATLIQTNELFQNHPCALKIAVYNDDIEVGNPLGSKSGINKLTMYYFSILNCPNRSSLSSIHLAIIAHSSDVKEFGHARVLRPLIKDLKRLENGLVITGMPEKIYGTIVHLPGDNLAANESQGFMGSFSANHFCRFCKMHQAETKHATREDKSLLRNTQDHQTDVNNPSGSSEHGVKGPCVFDELKYFNAVESFCPDLMHDIFEGIAKKEVALLLTHVISSKLISLNELNGIIKSYDYGFHDKKNKPSAILLERGEVKVRQTSSQMWCLLRLLPFMIGSVIGKGDEKWEVYLQLREIVEYIFSPVTTESSTYVLEWLVQVHHENFLSIYPGETLTPKHHFMTHYGQAVRRNGPLSDYWCIRFEAKHKMAKLVASSSCNFINVPKTVATRYQLNSFHHWSKQVDLVTPPTSYHHKGGVVTSVDYKGSSYHVGMAVCLSVLDDGQPEIWIIDKILNGPMLVCYSASVDYDPNIRAYLISDTNQNNVSNIMISALRNKAPMDILYYKNSKVISQRGVFI